MIKNVSATRKLTKSAFQKPSSSEVKIVKKTRSVKALRPP